MDPEEEFLFLLYKDLGCRFDKFPFLFFKHVRIVSCWVHPMLSVDAACAFAISLVQMDNRTLRDFLVCLFAAE